MSPPKELIQKKEELVYWIDVLISPNTKDNKKVEAVRNIRQLTIELIQTALE